MRNEPINHPGLALAALLNRCELNVQQAQEITGIPEFDLYQITTCRRGITALEATRLAFTIGQVSAAEWMDAQTKYDLHVAEYEYLTEFHAKLYDHWDAKLFAENPDIAEATRIAKYNYAGILARRSVDRVLRNV